MKSVEGPVLFYDGACGLCDRSVRWALKRLRTDASLKFAPLQGVTSAHRLPEALRMPPLYTVVYSPGIDEVPRIETAAIRALIPHVRMGGWRLLLPLITDPMYRWVSKRRHRWFGTHCSLPLITHSDRFLP